MNDTSEIIKDVLVGEGPVRYELAMIKNPLTADGEPEVEDVTYEVSEDSVVEFIEENLTVSQATLIEHYGEEIEDGGE